MRTSPDTRTPTKASIREQRAAVVRRLNNALLRCAQIDWAEGRNGTNWLAPIVADAEAGFGGALNSFELMKAMIEAGAPASTSRSARLREEVRTPRGKVLVPTKPFRPHVDGCAPCRRRARRPDSAHRAHRCAERVTADERRGSADAEFLTSERTPEGFFRVRDGLEAAIARSLAYAPYADCSGSRPLWPDLDEARAFR